MKNRLLFLRNLKFLQYVITIVLLPGFVLFPVVSHANPSGGSVVVGTVDFDGLGTSNLTINQLSDMAITDWQNFSIGVGESTYINQPGVNSLSINRVISGDPSAIMGQLRSTGSLMVINPNGILVGSAGVIDVRGALTLSTLDATNEDLLDGGGVRFLGGGSAGVLNQGSLSGQDIILLASTVDNQGLITASRKVALGAGNDIFVKQTGDGATISIQGGNPGGDTGISNAGTISAGNVAMKAHGNSYAMAINNRGTVRATGFETKGGRVVLSAGSGGGIINTGNIYARQTSGSGGEIDVTGGSVALSSGSLDASGEEGSVGGSVNVEAANISVGADSRVLTDGSSGGEINLDASETLSVAGTVSSEGFAGDGGRVDLAGNVVEVTSTAMVNASGLSGGIIRAGGGFQGNQDDIQNSVETTILEGSQFTADGREGNAGSVIIWSDNDTVFRGEVSTQAFGEVGNGGLVEVSGKENLTFDGVVSTLSANGETGTLLLDPTDVTVTTGVTTANRINDGTLRAALASNNVVIHTSSTGTEEGNILFESGTNVRWSSEFSFTALAHNDITVLGNIVNNGLGNINLMAGWSGSGEPDGDPLPIFVQDGGSATLGAFGLTDLLAIGRTEDRGAISINQTSNTNSVLVGSALGETNLVGDTVVLSGTDNGGFARVGFAGFTSPETGPTGAINVYADGDVTLRASQAAAIGGGAAQIGAGATNNVASGAITVKAGLTGSGDVDLIGGAVAGAFAKIGHSSTGVIVPDPTTSGELPTNEEEMNQIFRPAGINISFNQTEVLVDPDFLVIETTAELDDLFNLRPSNVPTVFMYFIEDLDLPAPLDGAIGVARRPGNQMAVEIDWAADTTVIPGGDGFTIGAELNSHELGHNFGLVHEPQSPPFAPPFDPDHPNLMARAVNGFVGLTEGQISTIQQSSLVLPGGIVNITPILVSAEAVEFETFDITIDVSAANDIDITGGTGSFAQIGHGSANLSSGLEGDINVSAGNNLNITGGAGGFATIGHGGVNATGTKHGALNVAASRNVNVQGGGGSDAFASIGMFGGNTVNTETINTSVSAGGNISVLGGSGSGAQIGFRGDLGSTSELQGQISVTSNGRIAVGSSLTNTQSHIGHGGANVSGSLNGAVTVSAGSSLSVLGGNTADSFSMIGHGGPNSGATQGGGISVLAGSDLTVRGGTGSDAFAGVGHGGNASSGSKSGAISLNAGRISLEGSSSGVDSYARVGHGGEGSTGSSNGAIDVSASSGISLKGGGGNRADAAIGHGGINADSSQSGDISVSAGNTLSLNGGAAEDSTATIGHGGLDSDGSKSGAVDIDAGNLVMRGGGARDSSTRIGHGGRLSDSSISGAISVLTTGQVDLDGGRGLDGFSLIGHGGESVTGALSGDIDLNAGTSITFNGGGVGSFVQVGHGGLSGTGSLNGDIEVSSGGNLVMTGGSAIQSFTGIGHGGVRSNGTKLGSISVNADRDISLLGGSNRVSFALIGMNGTNGFGSDSTRNTSDADVTVDAGRNLLLKAGNTGGAEGFAQIGHSSHNSARSAFFGTTSVTSGQDIELIGHGGRNFAKIGFGQRDPFTVVGATTSTWEGDIMVSAGDDLTLSNALIGHVDPDLADSGRHANVINRTGDTYIQVSRNNPDTFSANFGGIGDGLTGFEAYVDSSGNIVRFNYDFELNGEIIGGVFTTDADSALSSAQGGASELRLAIPNRPQNQIATGTRINNVDYTAPFPSEFVSLELDNALLDEFLNFIGFSFVSLNGESQPAYMINGRNGGNYQILYNFINFLAFARDTQHQAMRIQHYEVFDRSELFFESDGFEFATGILASNESKMGDVPSFAIEGLLDVVYGVHTGSGEAQGNGVAPGSYTASEQDRAFQQRRLEYPESVTQPYHFYNSDTKYYSSLRQLGFPASYVSSFTGGQ